MTGSYEGFLAFCAAQTLPTGQRFVLEAFQKLILREVWKGRRELLVLIPRGNGKTMLFAALAVYHLLLTPNAEAYIGAAERQQAEQLYRYAVHFAGHEEYAHLLKVYESYPKQIRRRQDQGFVKVLASDDSKSQGKHHGYAPTLALIDELHAHENPALYNALRTALGKKNGMAIVISTAGHDEDTTLGLMRSRALAYASKQVSVEQRLTVAESPDAKRVMLEWAALPEDDLSDPQIMKLCNPASFVTVDWLAEEIEAYSAEPWTFARLHANVWTLGSDAAFTPTVWAACEEPGLVIPERSEVYLGLDLAQMIDTTAVVPVWKREGRPAATAHARFFEPPRTGDPQRFRPVLDAIAEMANRWEIKGIVFDRYGGAGFFAQVLEEYEGIALPFIDCPQRKENQTRFTDLHYGAVQSRLLAHDGDPTLAKHALAAGFQHYPDGTFRYVKARRSQRPVDGLIANAMAFEHAFVPPEKTVTSYLEDDDAELLSLDLDW